MLVVGSIYEHNFVNKQFNELHGVLTVLYQKIDDETATQDDVYAVQKNWLNKKESLHFSELRPREAVCIKPSQG